MLAYDYIRCICYDEEEEVIYAVDKTENVHKYHILNDSWEPLNIGKVSLTEKEAMEFQFSDSVCWIDDQRNLVFMCKAFIVSIDFNGNEETYKWIRRNIETDYIRETISEVMETDEKGLGINSKKFLAQ